MRAAFYERHGPARDVLRVGEVPDPEPQPGEVLVRVRASGVNPTDTKARGRGDGPARALQIPHQDGAGVIEAVGEGVDPARVGQRVWLYFAHWQRDHGTAAELIALPERQAVPLPDATSFTEGACLGIPALTAYHCVYGDRPVDGLTILVTGGAGAVGWYACALARRGGAHVVATVSGEEKAALARRAGAHDTTSYDAAGILDGSVDRVVDVAFGANLDTSLRVLGPGGTIATYASDAVRDIPFRPLLMHNATVHFVLVYLLARPELAAAVSGITEALEDGDLPHNVAAPLPLEEVATAHERVEAGADANVVLEP